MMDSKMIDDIIAYENGNLTVSQTASLFQKLINTGHAWTLQGHYGRMSRYLITEGYCYLPTEDLKDGQVFCPDGE
jgi:hypothetical protein